MSDWHPIETAPIDGPILIWSQRWGVGFWGMIFRWEMESEMLDATHWMPLPKPPEEKA